MLIRVHNKTAGKDVYEDVQRTKRGDIITVQPDGWEWSREEQTAPYWRILKVPTLTKQEAELYDKDEHQVRVAKDGANQFDKPATSQRRGYNFDLDSPLLSAELVQYLADDRRSSPGFQLKADLPAATVIVRKAPVTDPKVFG